MSKFLIFLESTSPGLWQSYISRRQSCRSFITLWCCFMRDTRHLTQTVANFRPIRIGMINQTVQTFDCKSKRKTLIINKCEFKRMAMHLKAARIKHSCGCISSRTVSSFTSLKLFCLLAYGRIWGEEMCKGSVLFHL